MKKTMSAMLWVVVWVVMVIEQVPVVKAGPERGEKKEEKAREKELKKLKELSKEEEIAVRSEILFGERFLSVGEDKSGDEALLEVLQKGRELEKYESEHRGSRWVHAVRYELGREYTRRAYFSRALQEYKKVWDELKGSQEGSNGRKLAQKAVGELVSFYARLGRTEKLRTTLKEMEGWALQGRAKELVSAARQGLWVMDNKPEEGFKCGPMALARIRERLKKEGKLEGESYHEKIRQESSSKEGISLKRVQCLAQEMGMDYEMAYREKGAPIIVPSVVHWKEDHYAAVLGESATGIYEVEDPIFASYAGSWQVSQEVLDKEGSGYYLVPQGKGLPPGWRKVPSQEGEKVWGKGGPDSFEEQCHDTPEANGCGGGSGSGAGGSGGGGGSAWLGAKSSVATGMPHYQFYALECSLSIRDVPVGYEAARGPGVPFGLEYVQRSEHHVDKGFNGEKAPLGPKWDFDWEGCVQVKAAPLAQGQFGNVSLITESFHNQAGVYRRKLSLAGGPYGGQAGSLSGKADKITGIWQAWSNPAGYVRTFADGSKEEYRFREGAIIETPDPLGTVTYHLSKIIDRHGNETHFEYDYVSMTMNVAPDYENIGNPNPYVVQVPMWARLATITDSAGKVTKYKYYSDEPSDAEAYFRVKEIEDPYGRKAQFEYDAEWRLIKITDAEGLASHFQYDPEDPEFIQKMETPYGTTQFEYDEVYGSPGYGQDQNGQINERMGRYVQASDAGGTQRQEYMDFMYTPSGEPVPTVPGVTFAPMDNRQTSYYWDRQAWAKHPGDYSKAKMTRWLRRSADHSVSHYKESEKMALENRVWYRYPGQGSGSLEHIEAINGGPSLIARVGENGVTQYVKLEYNELGNRTKVLNAMGRTLSYEYEANKIDLKSVKVGSNLQAIKTIAYQNGLPVSVTGADGQTTTFTYNSHGQVTSATPPDGQSTTMTYEESSGQLTAIDLPGEESASFTYDKGQVKTITLGNGYVVSYTYDALDRNTQTQYPDGSFEQTLYDRLDASWYKDRAGNWSYAYYDTHNQPAYIKDSNGDWTQWEWCACGGLEKMIDPQGNTTTWMRDLQGRVTSKVYANGQSESWLYDVSGRIKVAKDLQGATLTTNYYSDGNVQDMVIDNAALPATAVKKISFSYDQNFGQATQRLEETVSGIQKLTTYAYKPYGQLGGGKLSLIDGPQSDDTVTYDYDALGRMVSTTINGMANSVIYDSEGRVQSRTNALGTFINQYEGNRLIHVQASNGLEKIFGYESVDQGNRLQSISLKVGNTLLSKHHYQRDVLGRIQEWEQTRSAEVKSWHLDYDAIGQLLKAEKKANNLPEKAYHYGYDGIGNRLWQLEDQEVKGYSYNQVNQLTQVQGGIGEVRLQGEVSKSANVQVAGKPVALDESHLFSTTVPVTAGVNIVPVQMTDAQGASIQRQVKFSVSGSGQESLTYDGNGNLLSHASASYEWDALNRLTQVTQGATQVKIQYDGEGRMSQLSESNAQGPFAQREYLWVGHRLVRERGTDPNGTYENNYYSQGFVQTRNAITKKYYYGRDHLGSIREIFNEAGQLETRYDYTPFGERTKIAGTPNSIESPLGFTGHYYNSTTGLHFTRFRPYDAKHGRWLSRDPLGELGGLNLYGYVFNNPANLRDPLGLAVPGVDSGYWDAPKNPDPRVPGLGPDGTTIPSSPLMLGNTMVLNNAGPDPYTIAASIAISLIVTGIIAGTGTIAENNNDDEGECKMWRDEYELLKYHKELAESRLLGIQNLIDRLIAAGTLSDIKSRMGYLAFRYNTNPKCEGKLQSPE